LFPNRHPVQGWLGYEQMAPFDQFRHHSEEKGQQQRANVSSIHIGIGHDDGLVIAEPVRVVLVLSDPGTQGRNHGSNFLVLEHLIETRFFYIEDLAAQRQDRLKFAVAPLLGGPSGRIPLDDEDLTLCRVPFLAVRQLSGQ